MRRTLRLLPLLMTASLLCSCDWTGLAYDHLDFLARRYLAGFVDLRPPQQQAFDDAFGQLWRWHRSTELPRYAAALRHLAAVSQTTLTPAQIEQEMDTLDRLGEPLLRRVSDQLAPLLTQLDDTQVAQILDEIDRRIDKSAQREAKLDAAHWRQHELDETGEQIEHYAGPLQPSQQQLLRNWSQTLARDPALSRRAAEVWRARFAAVLQRRHEAGNAQRLQALADIQDPAVTAFEQQRAATRTHFAELLAALSTGYTPKQRQHLQTSLNDLANDLDALAAEGSS